MTSLMKVLAIKRAKVAHPTGDPNFAVMQAFPGPFKDSDADPFLMLDHFGPMKSKGPSKDPDAFSVGWHPHRGMDICTYLVEGIGRHADSLGNRGDFASPGMQWISVGSGIEHAEGTATPAGADTVGFQIWINVPARHKLDDPVYGTETPDKLPVCQPYEGVFARILAGEFNGLSGPFKTKQPLQMVDFRLSAGATLTHDVPLALDNCSIYVADGSASCSGHDLPKHSVVRFDASGADAKRFECTAGPKGAMIMLFAGKRINEPIAWRGPFVMNSEREIQQTITEYQAGQFPPKRVSWDYRKISAFPKDHPARAEVAAHQDL